MSTRLCYGAPMPRPRTGRHKGLYGDQAVGARLRQFRKSRGLTQEVLARRVETDRKVVAAWENGRRAMPASKARHLADEFPTLSLDWLLLGKGSAPAETALDRIDRLEKQVGDLIDEVRVLRKAVTLEPQGKAAAQVLDGDLSALEEVARLSPDRDGGAGKGVRTDNRASIATGDVIPVP